MITSRGDSADALSPFFRDTTSQSLCLHKSLAVRNASGVCSVPAEVERKGRDNLREETMQNTQKKEVKIMRLGEMTEKRRKRVDRKQHEC